MNALEVVVTLENIMVESTNGDEIGGMFDLEVRGYQNIEVINADTNETVLNHLMFNRVDDDSVQILVGERHVIQLSRIVKVYPNELLRIGGHLWEDDDLSADDNLSWDYRIFNFNELINTDHRVKIEYANQGQWVSVHWYLLFSTFRP